jgi:xanthine dehydrogenase small subunit
MAIEFQLNGKAVRLGAEDPHQTLLHWLRARGLTGTKEGCAEGECGACAVAWLRQDRNSAAIAGPRQYVPVNSCLLPVGELAGTSVVTVEHLAHEGELHPVQRTLVECGGSQCGYCTPGFVMSLFCQYYRSERAYDPQAISGNLCRCTGYRPIVDAAKTLEPPKTDDPFLIQLQRPAPQAEAPDGPTFHQPNNLDRVFELLGQVPDAVLLGGGTDLMVQANQRYVRYPALISLENVSELQQLQATDSSVVIGANVTLATLEAWVGTHAPDLVALQQLLPLFASRLIRNRATLGGNLGTASPIGDSPPVLLALDAVIALGTAAGIRRVPADDFFQGYRKTQLAKGEVIHSVHFPRPAAAIQRFYKVSKRTMDDISTVAGAFALDVDTQGCVERLRLAYGGIAATPLRARQVEQAAVGKPWNESTLQMLLPLLQSLGTPMSDHRGSAEYRRAMVGKLFEQFFYESLPVAVAAE